MSLFSSRRNGFLQACVDRPVSTLAAYAAFLILGVFALTQMKLTYAPEVPQARLLVACDAPGFPPDEIRKLVTLPLEDTLSSLKGLRRMESYSKAGQAVIKLDLWWGTDLRRAQVEAAQLVDLAYARLPQGADKPLVLPLSQNENPTFWIGMFPKKGDLVQAREAAEREFRNRIQQTEGVGGVTLVGGEQEEVRVDVDQEKLFAKGLTLADVAQALASGNIEVPLGTVESQGRDLSLKADAKAATVPDLAQILILSQKPSSTPVAVGDVAKLSLGPQKQESFFVDGDREGLLFLVGRQPGASPIAVADRLRAKVEELQKEQSREFDFRILRDESLSVRSTLSDLSSALLVGSLIAFGTLFLFVRDVRSALILTSALPISALFAFLALWLCGRSLNVMTLGGLALGLGMLVDNSVVVLENFAKRLGSGPPDSEAVVEATLEMAGSTIGSTLTVAIVFVPLIFLPGSMGALFTDLSLSVVFSMAASFLVSVTWVPVLYRWTKYRKTPPTDKVEKAFERLFRLGLRRPWFLLVPVVGFSLLAVVSYLDLKKELFNPIDQGFVQLVVRFAPGVSLAKLKAKTQAVNRALAGYSGVEHVVGFGGREPHSPFFLANPQKPAWEITDLLILRSEASAFRLQSELNRDFPGLVTTLPASPVEALLNLAPDTHRWVLTADTPEILDREVARLRSDPLVQTENLLTQPLYVVRPRTDLDAQLHLTPQATAQALSGDLDGLTATEFWKNGFPLPVRVTLPETDKSNLTTLERIRIPVTDAKGLPTTSVALSVVATVTPSSNAPLLLRINKKEASTFELKPQATPAELARFQADFPDAESLQKGFLEENLATLGLLAAFAVFFLYLYLVVQFESYFVPLLILLTFPLSAAGIFGSLTLFGFSWNINTFFAVLILMGSAVNVAIILVENYRRRGLHSGLFVAVVLGGTRERVRPILITTLTTVVGSLPVAVDLGAHSTQSGMATAIIGGHLVSSFLTLLVLPQLYLAWIKHTSHRQKQVKGDA
jgi:multidrug efflux pump subunit AcrB